MHTIWHIMLRFLILEGEMATENPIDRGAWWATFHEFAKSWTQLSEHACKGLHV